MWKHQKTIDRHEEELSALRRQIVTLETTSRKLDMEFTELYDKVRHQMSRMAKRDAAASKANGDLLVPDSSDSHLDGLDPISRSIMLRRSGYTGPKQ